MPQVIGTAGHVDHGKSALIQALTGIDPDRLAEEKARGLTIDLGFAWTTLPSGREVGFVDVPGHERFVHNMLAGVGGIGCALFVVDASEGWRPQSAEHLAILDLLGVPAGVVALTKVDLVDAATRDRVAAEVGERLRGTTLDGAEVVATAAPSGVGIAQLAAALDAALDRLGEPPDRGRPRLPVDRVFTMRGSGTVVTGTLSGGSLRAQGEAELLPGGRRVRVRGLQGHGRPLAEATPARRVAVNLAGVATDEVVRGEVLVLPGQWAATGVADVRLRCLAAAPGPLRARGAYLVYAGAAESAARLQPLDATEVGPGGDALVRLHLERPLVLDVFEPLVLRDSGRDETVGGGIVLDPFPPGVVRGTAARVRRTEELEAREAAGRPGLLERVLAERGVVPLADLPRLAAIAPDRLPALPAPWSPGRAEPGAGAPSVVRSRTLAWDRSAWTAAEAAVLEAVRRQHRSDPSAPGLPAQAARAAALDPGRPAPAPDRRRPPAPAHPGPARPGPAGRRRPGTSWSRRWSPAGDWWPTGPSCGCPGMPSGSTRRSWGCGSGSSGPSTGPGSGCSATPPLPSSGPTGRRPPCWSGWGCWWPSGPAATSGARPSKARSRPCGAASPTGGRSRPPRPRRPSAPPGARPSRCSSTSTAPGSPSARATCGA